MAGAAAGARTYCEWASADKREAGHMEIMAAAPGLVVIEVQRSRPKEESLVFEFVLSSGADTGTIVRSVAKGPATYASRVVGMLWSRERRLGKQFKANLAGLKAAAESTPFAPSGGLGAGLPGVSLRHSCAVRSPPAYPSRVSIFLTIGKVRRRGRGGELPKLLKIKDKSFWHELCFL